MGQIILGTGSRAEVPYRMEKFYINLYSVEELCYLLVEKAELLDGDIRQRGLAEWLDEACGLDRLADALYQLIGQDASTASFVGTILEYVNLYPAETIAETERLIRENEGLSPYERDKAKADYMLAAGRYRTALSRYRILSEQLPETERPLRARILYNMGVACAGMFMFARAAEYFMQAYEAQEDEESLEMYLAALRMQYDDREYIDYIAEHPEYHDVSLRVERRMEQAFGQFEGSEENRMLFTFRVLREEGSGTAGVSAEYYREIEKLTAGLKDAYRKMYD